MIRCLARAVREERVALRVVLARLCKASIRAELALSREEPLRHGRALTHEAEQATGYKLLSSLEWLEGANDANSFATAGLVAMVSEAGGHQVEL